MNKITCICLGVRSMQRALKFYRDGLGYETDCKDDDPPVCFFDTPGTKFELYPIDALARDISENDPPKGSGFAGITLAYNVKNKEDVGSVHRASKKGGRNHRQRAPRYVLGRIPRVFCRSGRILLGGCLGA